jgi:hypothetical protein
MTETKTVGSKAEVFHGTAKHTSGGLKQKDLMKTKAGRIVSRKKHAAGKKAILRLFRAGYKPTKGTFTAMRKGRVTRRGKKGMKGGAAAMTTGPTTTTTSGLRALDNITATTASMPASAGPMDIGAMMKSLTAGK